MVHIINFNWNQTNAIDCQEPLLTSRTVERISGDGALIDGNLIAVLIIDITILAGAGVGGAGLSGEYSQTSPIDQSVVRVAKGANLIIS